MNILSFLGGTDVGGASIPLAVSAANPLPVSATIAGGVITVQGASPDGTTTNPNPVITGGRDAGGVVRTAKVSTSGVLLAQITSALGTAVTIGTPTDAATFANSFGVNAAAAVFNGTTWDRLAKPQTGFKVPSCAATNNAASVKATAGTIFNISGIVAVATTRWLKFFSTTGVPNPAVLAQLYLFALPASLAFSFNFAQGLYVPTGIGIAIVANPADLDNTAVAAGDVLGLLVTFA